MAFKNRTQAGNVAADILKDMPVDAMKHLLHQMARSQYSSDESAYSGFAEWLVEALQWNIEWEQMMHATEVTRIQEKAQERIDEFLQGDSDL